MDEKHISVSLGDDKIKEISEAIGSKTCNKILDALADEQLTVSDLSKKLKMPLNTVDYNIKKLVKARLIEKASHWWSVKGKKMPTYKVSNKKIIISPKKSVAKVFAWTIGLTGLLALTLREIMRPVETAIGSARDFAVRPATEEIMAYAPVAADQAVASASFLQSISPWSWFLIGAWLAILLFFAITMISERREK